MTDQVPEFGGCLWPIDEACNTDEWQAFDETVRIRALSLASSTLERLTGGRVGVCPIKLRPCSQGHAQRSWVGDVFGDVGMHPVNWGGTWSNACGHTIGCGCTSRSEILLPGPVGRIDEVKVDGIVVDPGLYRVDLINGLPYLVRNDGGAWPLTQNLDLDDEQPGTFSVTYLNAYPVDSNGAYAVGVLALEFAKACTGAKNCKLPAGTTSIVRNGVAVTITPGAFPNGTTGIREVDAYVMLWNPGNLSQPMTVWSPDMPVVRRTVIGSLPAGLPGLILDGGGA